MNDQRPDHDDPHRVLQLSPAAPAELIDDAYWALIGDVRSRYPAAPAAAKIAELTQAYKQINDARRQFSAADSRERDADGTRHAKNDGGTANFYELLAVHAQAEQPIIELAYATISRRRVGPNRQTDGLAEAYRTLTHPDRRAAYDAALRAEDARTVLDPTFRHPSGSRQARNASTSPTNRRSTSGLLARLGALADGRSGTSPSVVSGSVAKVSVIPGVPAALQFRRREEADATVIATIRAHWPVLLALVVCFACHAYHMTLAPAYDIDEGSILGQAWAVVHLGKLDPYTYWYDHPPLGWIALAPVSWALGVVGIGASEVDRGRVSMLFIDLASTFMVFHLSSRLTQNRLAALVAALLLAVSPLAIDLHRLVKLDNVATVWMLASVLLILNPRPSLTQAWLSALCMGAATLSKEPALFFAPAALYILFDRIDARRRPFALFGWLTVYVCAVSVYPLFALLKGELFPTGTLLGGSSEHVSLLGTIFGRASDLHGAHTFMPQLRDWWHRDPVLIWLGVGAVAINVLAALKDRNARIALALALPYAFFLSRGGAIRDYWIIPLLPALALNVAVVIAAVLAWSGPIAEKLMRRRASDDTRGRHPAWLGAPVLVAAGVLLSVVPVLAVTYASTYRGEFGALFGHDDNSSHQAAEAWIQQNLDPSKFIVIDSTFLVDLRQAQRRSAAGPTGAFDRTYHYWIVDADPAVRTRLLHQDWRNVDYVVMTPAMAGDIAQGNVSFVASIVAHANPIAEFASWQNWVKVLAVNKLSDGSTQNAQRPQAVPPLALQLGQNASVGAPSVPLGSARDAVDIFYALRCKDDIASVVTTKEVFYAELPCVQLPADHALLQHPVRITVTTGDPVKLSIESTGTNAITLAVGRVWLQQLHLSSNPGNGSRPATIPNSAAEVQYGLSVGHPRGGASRKDAHTLFAWSCHDDLLVLSTTKEVLYAEIPCTQVPPEETFLNRPVRLGVEPGIPTRLHVESAGVQTLELIVGRVWDQELQVDGQAAPTAP